MTTAVLPTPDSAFVVGVLDATDDKLEELP